MSESIKPIDFKPKVVDSSSSMPVAKSPIQKNPPNENIGERLSATSSSKNTPTLLATSPKLAEYGIDLNKPFKITPQILSKMRKKGPKGFWENLKDGVKNMIPFGSTIYESYKSYKLLSIVKKMEKSGFASLSEEEREQLILFQLEKAEDELRGSTFMGKVATTLSYLPAFAGEFALTGGLYRIGASASKYAFSFSKS